MTQNPFLHAWPTPGARPMKSALSTAFFAATLLLLPLSAEAAKKKCKCNKDQKLRANARLTLTEAEEADAVAQHLPWGYPTSTKVRTNVSVHALVVTKDGH